jgi:uncharacterized protein (TIGR02996 family)
MHRRMTIASPLDDPEQRRLRRAVGNNPDDIDARLAYADWAERAGFPEIAECIRAYMDAMRMKAADEKSDWESRLMDSDDAGADARRLYPWHERVPYATCQLHRAGFAMDGNFNAVDLLLHEDEIYASAPIRHITIDQERNEPEAIAQLYRRRRFATMSLHSERINQGWMQRFIENCRSDQPTLRALLISSPAMDEGAVRILAESDVFPGLAFASFAGPYQVRWKNIRDWDGSIITGNRTPFAQRIALDYPHVAWAQFIERNKEDVMSDYPFNFEPFYTLG